MLRFVILATLLCTVSAEDSDGPSFTEFGRIVNGDPTTIEEVPWQVSIQTNSASHFCGGSLIGPYHVVTAAHCMQKYAAKKLLIRVGSSTHKSGGETVGVTSFVNHPKFTTKNQNYDIALLKLKRAIFESTTVRYIPLAEKRPPNGAIGLVSGWGVNCFFWCTSVSKSLQKIEVKITDIQTCKETSKYKKSQLKDAMICGYEPKKDACQGDSGGPLVSNGTLVGIISWGKSCGSDGYPGVYSDVSVLRPWVESTKITM